MSVVVQCLRCAHESGCHSHHCDAVGPVCMEFTLDPHCTPMDCHTVACYDCGLSYGSEGWMDAHVANDVWARISPSGDSGGILCISCMARRCERLGIRAPIFIGSGPFSENGPYRE